MPSSSTPASTATTRGGASGLLWSGRPSPLTVMAQYMSAPPCLVPWGPRRIRGRPVTLHCRSLPGELSSPDWGRQGVIVVGPGGGTEVGSGLEEAKLLRALGRLYPAVDAELAVETLDMRLDRVDLDVEGAG